MVESTQALVAKWRRWKAKHPEWPLTVSGNGQWCKRVMGRRRYFGPLAEKDIALKMWLAEKDYLLAGEDPPEWTGKITVAALCEKYKADATIRRDSGELSVTYFRDMRFAANFLDKNMVGRRPVETLRPDHFAKLRQAIAATGRGLRGQKNLIQAIRSIFLWGAAMDYHPAVGFGPRFKPPTSDAMARESEASGRTRFIDRKDILALLALAKPAMKCMILLGVNCGFYSSDSIHLTFSRLHLDHDTPHHDFARVKNGRRRVAALWPETVEALTSYIQHRRGDCTSDRVILNQYGRPYQPDAPGRGIRTSFSGLLAKAGVTVSPGTSIGSLRHTYGW